MEDDKIKHIIKTTENLCLVGEINNRPAIGHAVLDGIRRNGIAASLYLNPQPTTNVKYK